MKKPSKNSRSKQRKASRRKSAATRTGKIHPVVIYPFRQPGDDSDLRALYDLVARLDSEKDIYARPITVLDRKTHYSMEGNKRFGHFRQEVIARHSAVLDAWCVDTCQMWYAGLGLAFEEGAPGDVYWLIPGDFNYGTPMGQEVLGQLHDLPEIILELNQDICIGEIASEPGDSKHLIDTYGTFGLLYNWFPAEAKELRLYTEQPRSEFLAVSHSFLREALAHRWYAYEQTLVMLLQAVFNNNSISQFFVGHISDQPEGRESLASAMQQVERTERILKMLWCERNELKAGWVEKYRTLETHSEQVLRTALLILQNLLG